MKYAFCLVKGGKKWVALEIKTLRSLLLLLYWNRLIAENNRSIFMFEKVLIEGSLGNLECFLFTLTLVSLWHMLQKTCFCLVVNS